MPFVEEISRGSDPNIYFSSSINLKYTSSHRYKKFSTSNSRKRFKPGAYNLQNLQLQNENENEKILSGIDNNNENKNEEVNYNEFENLIEERQSNKRLQELNKENYNESSFKLELPKSGLNISFKNFNKSSYPNFDLMSYSNQVKNQDQYQTKKVRQGLTANTRKILSSRKTLSNYIDEEDSPEIKKLLFDEKNSSIYPKRNFYNLPGKKLCSICGSSAMTKCVKCNSRYCSVKCYDVHNETRCSNY
ncbi:Vps71p ASCRUDRAFT_69033 [Ascoidea rubescens DSM 1968]|uniref:HIT-type domain-containing protein n=1 Tax=Ascoidea rubescens DSM 1968 TaxID=1344418 RepID=A0A1D2VKS7_9ASCO|nr:hypothetical protein ASCRUDRAFT_69033 [Ascoidea rubescens DSM 1968]ODV62209.1 hypothetical protein ASCRUDRAFT_69033 [Ascoidea rubescens DSM 1968]